MMEPTATTSTDLTTSSPSFAAAFGRLRQDHTQLSDWQRENLAFVPVRGSWSAASEADFDLDEEINKFLSPKHTDKKVMLLLGDSGSGKSLYTQRLVVQYAQVLSPHSPIPIWISLPALKDPVNRAIEESLASAGFNAQQIETLRQSRHFIFILDAVDEIRATKNLYVTNQLERWNAKVIFTCRREYLYTFENYKTLFMPYQNQKPQMLAFEEITLRLFNPSQIQLYLQQYVKMKAQQPQDASLSPEWLDWQRYQQAIEDIQGLQQLIKTPFMLKLTMEVLPTIVERFKAQKDQSSTQQKRMTQAALYDVFIEQWFIRQEQKLKTAKQIPDSENIKPAFWEYAKSLAQAMHERQLTQVVYEPSKELTIFDDTDKTEEENPWKPFFNPDNKRLAFLHTACLIREISPRHYAFIHASLIEYFITRQLYEIFSHSSSDTNTNIDKSFTPPSSASSANDQPSNNIQTSRINDKSIKSLTPSYFYQRLITKEANILQFLVDRLEEQPDLKEVLFQYIYSSRYNSENRIAAANAITILNFAHVPFSGMNLEGVQIPSSNLSYGLLENTKLVNADLTGVSFNNAFLKNADLSNSKMSEVDFGEYPTLPQQESVGAICYSRNGQYLAIAILKNIVIFETKYGELYTTFKGHTSEITSLSFSSNSKYLASGCKNSSSTKERDSRIIIWDIQARKMYKILNIEKASWIYAISFSPDDKLMAVSVNSRYAHLWNVVHENFLEPLSDVPTDERERFTMDSIGIWALAFSPNSQLLACGFSEGALRIWDVLQRKIIFKLMKAHNYSINSINFSPDGTLLATGGGSFDKTGDNSVCLWETTNFSLVYSYKGHAASVRHVIFHPIKKIIVSGSSDNTIRLWNIEDGQPLGPPLLGHKSTITGLAFTPDGSLLTSSSTDKNVRFWQVNSFEGIHRNFIKEVSVTIKGIAVHPDNKLLAIAQGETVFFIDLNKFTRHERTLPLDIRRCFTISSDQRLLAYGLIDHRGQFSIGLWDINNQRILMQIPLPVQRQDNQNANATLKFSPDNKFLAISLPNSLSLPILNIERFLCDMRREVSAVAMSPDGMWLAQISNSNSLLKLNPPHYSVELHPGPVIEDKSVVTFSPDGKLLAVGKDNLLRLWDMERMTLLNTNFEGFTFKITNLAISPHNKYIAGSGVDYSVYVWDIENHKIIAKFVEVNDQVPDFYKDIPRDALEQRGITCIAFTADEKWLITGSDEGSDNKGTCCIWDIQSQTRVASPIKPGGRRVLSIALTPDSLLMASCSFGDIKDGKFIKLWNIKDRKLINTLAFNNVVDLGYKLAFSHGGKILVLASSTNAQLWDMHRKQKIADIYRSFGNIRSITFSSDDRTIFIAGTSLQIIHLDQIEKLADHVILPDEDGEDSHTYKQHATFSANGKFLAFSEKHAYPNSNHFWISLWDFEARRCRWKIHSDKLITAIAFNFDGKITACGNSEGLLTLWSTQEKKVIDKLNGHSSKITCISFNSDNTLLVSGSADKTIRFWSPKTYQCTAIYNETETILDIQFSYDNENLVISTTHSVQIRKRQYNENGVNYILMQYVGIPPLELGGVRLSGSEGLSFQNLKLFKLQGKSSHLQHTPETSAAALTTYSSSNPHTYFQPKPSLNPSDDNDKRKDDKCLLM